MDERLHKITGKNGIMTVFPDRIEIVNRNVTTIQINELRNIALKRFSIMLTTESETHTFKFPPIKNELAIRAVETIHQLLHPTRAYTIQGFDGSQVAMIFATDLLSAIKKFTDMFSEINKKQYTTHYTFFGGDRAMLRMADLSEMMNGEGPIAGPTIFESNKVQYRSWRPDFED